MEINLKNIDLSKERIIVIKYNLAPVKFLKVSSEEDIKSAISSYHMHNSLSNVIDAPLGNSFLAIIDANDTLFYTEERGFVKDGPLLELLLRECAHFFFIFQMLVASNNMDKWLDFIDNDEIREIWAELRDS